MNPTLTARDLLKIKPSNTTNKPKIGDVVLFTPPQFDYPVIHRIANISNRGIRTRGDNCRDIDPWYLNEKDIYGRVVAAHQGNKRRKIGGGFIGRLTGLSCLVRRKTNGLAVKLLRPAYRSLCTGGFLYRLIPVRLTPQVATFRSAANASHKLLLGKRVIGSYDAVLLKWQIRRPYRILIDESTLPRPR